MADHVMGFPARRYEKALRIGRSILLHFKALALSQPMKQKNWFKEQPKTHVEQSEDTVCYFSTAFSARIAFKQSDVADCHPAAYCRVGTWAMSFALSLEKIAIRLPQLAVSIVREWGNLMEN